MSLPKLYVNSTYSFTGNIRRRSGNEYTNVDIRLDAVNLVIKETDDPDDDELINASADCASDGVNGNYSLSVDIADELDADASYFYELYWTYNGGLAERVLEKGKIKALKRLV